MLENTFLHIPGVDAVTERGLWTRGYRSWSQVLESTDDDLGDLRRAVSKSVSALAQRRHQHFARGLKVAEAWRAFPEFRSSCVYLDIETDGGQTGDSITTIGMFDGLEYVCLVKDDDLGNFPDIISRYSMIVTFFGAGFDLPMLQRCFRTVRFDQIHIDLCPTLRRVGLRGGLKSIERQLNITRGHETAGLGGRDAIHLWRKYRLGRDEKALQTLIDYNREDVVNLETLAEHAYSHLRSQVFPFEG